MRFAVVSHHLPHPEGTAHGRQLHAVWQAAREAGHDVTVTCWGMPPEGLDVPDWVTLAPHHDPGGWRRLPATLRRPRWALAETGWSAPPDAVAWAEEPESYAAVAAAPRRALTVAHSALLDAVALRRPRLAVVQQVRAERYATGRASSSSAYSARVARATGARHVLPIAVAVPDDPLPLVEEPAALLIADWGWPPNQVALRQLLASWRRVTDAVPHARLLVAGRGGDDLPPLPAAVEVLGEVAAAAEAMSRAAVLAFPCPATSGPKVKVLEALGRGLPVVTTPAGVEGLDLSPGAAAVSPVRNFAGLLAAVLGDPDRRARMARQGREDVLRAHTPAVALSARLASLATG